MLKEIITGVSEGSAIFVPRTTAAVRVLDLYDNVAALGLRSFWRIRCRHTRYRLGVSKKG